MVLGYVLIGIFAGVLAFLVGVVVALNAGVSLWYAALAYCVVGAASTLALGVMLPASRAAGIRGSRDDEGAAALATPASHVGGGPTDTLATAADVGGMGMRILAVDDDAFILELLPKIVARAGCPDITTAKSGAEALERIESAPVPFDCLLLDINMPGMDGIDLCARIRAMPAYRDTPIVMLTAMTDLDHLDRAFRAGASDYTTKPFDIIEFGERLQVAQAQVAVSRTAAAKMTPDDAVTTRRDRSESWGPARLGPLPGVPAFIEHEALQNYLTRLSGSALTGAYVMGVVVDRTFPATAEAISITPMPILMNVARAIDDVLGAAGYLMAYAGSGEFLIVSNASSLPNAAAVEMAIQDRLDRLATKAEQSAMIAAGTPVRPERRRVNRARSAFEIATRLAIDRAATRRIGFRPYAVRLFSR